MLNTLVLKAPGKNCPAVTVLDANGQMQIPYNLSFDDANNHLTIKLDSNEPKPWKPKVGEYYWCCFSTNTERVYARVAYVIWADDAFDRKVYTEGNVFRTKKLAKSFIKKQSIKRTWMLVEKDKISDPLQHQ